MRTRYWLALALLAAVAVRADVETTAVPPPMGGGGTSGVTFTGTTTFTGQIVLPDGSAAAPSWRVTSEASGFYRNSANQLALSLAGTAYIALRTGGIFPLATNSRDLGGSGELWHNVYAGTSLQGATTKALTESAATAVVQVAVPSGDHTGGTFRYCIFASDATDQQQRCSDVRFSAINKAGTETCTMSPGTVTEALDSNASAISTGTLTYAVTCTTTPTNAVQFEVNAVSSLTQTTLQAEWFLELRKIQTVTAQ